MKSPRLIQKRISRRQEVKLTKQAKPKILLIADSPNWAFDHVANNIKTRLSDTFTFTIKFIEDEYNEDEYDLIYVLSWHLVKLMKTKVKNPAKYVAGIRSHRSWRRENFSDVVVSLNEEFQKIHVLSKKLYRVFEPYVTDLSYVTNGVDLSFFTPTTKKSVSSKKITVGWAGRKADPIKGFDEFIAPLSGVNNITLVYCGIDSDHLDKKDVKQFYENIDIYVCSSYSEGCNNPLLEAAAMGKAIVTTDVGVVPEYLENEVSALIVDQEQPSFISAILRLRDDPALRSKLGKNAQKAVKKFAWDVVSKQYREFFEEGLKGVSKWNPQYPASFTDVKLLKPHLPVVRRLEELPEVIRQKDEIIHTIENEKIALSKELRGVYESKSWKYIRSLANIRNVRKP
jgi:glycosyltransferase involved in cell wall biosynthesis